MRTWFSQRNGVQTVDETASIQSTPDDFTEEARTVADVQIEDGIIKIAGLDIQDPKAAAVLAEYPQVRWAEITRRALKIGLGYLKGGGKD
jgi:hypothetical protein